MYDLGYGQVASRRALVDDRFELVSTSERLLELLPYFMGAETLAIDTEGTGLWWWEDSAGGISLCADGQKAFYIPFCHKSGPQVPYPVVSYALEMICSNPNITKVFHNIKYDWHMIRSTFGFDIQPPYHDTMMMVFVEDNTAPKSLKEQATRRFGPELSMLDQQRDFEMKARGARHYCDVPSDTMADYACGDALYTWLLSDQLLPTMERDHIIYDTEIELVQLVFDMERAGVLIDKQFLLAGSETIRARVPEVEGRLSEIAGHSVNVGSTAEVARLLYETLQMPVLEKTKKGARSTAEQVLLNLPHHEAIDLVLEGRTLKKVISTYIHGLIGKIAPDGRLHAKFNQTGAETGRFSSSKPSLQQIPREGSVPISIRGGFVPAPGHVFVFADYRQCEMYVFAHYSGDPDLLQMVRDGYDFHRATASLVYNKLPELITKPERKWSKRINFGYVYGIGARKLSRQLRCSMTEAKAFLRRYNERFPAIPVFMAKCRADYEERGFVQNIFGRQRKIPWDKAYRSVNSLVQGTAADIIKDAMVRLIPLLRASPVRTLIQVHDELIFEIPIWALGIVPQIVSTMERFNFRVPMRVDVEWSDVSWGYKRKWSELGPWLEEQGQAKLAKELMRFQS